MKTWLKRTLIGIAGASVLFGGIAACSHRPHFGWQPMSEEDAAHLKTRMIDRIGARLELDDAQKARLGLVADRLREQRNAFVGSGDARAELLAVVAGPSFDRERARSFVDGRTAAIQAHAPELLAALADFYDGLSPEQQEKVRDSMRRGRARRGWHP